MQLRQWPASGEPVAVGFDWKAYLQHYPELLQPPHTLEYCEEAAWWHYRTVGRAQGRVASPLRLRLRYTGANASPGLTNQLLAHLSAFMIAYEAGAEVVVPPFISRSGFVQGPSWQWQPAESVLDINRMAEYWRPRGLTIVPVSCPGSAGRVGVLRSRNALACCLLACRGWRVRACVQHWLAGGTAPPAAASCLWLLLPASAPPVPVSRRAASLQAHWTVTRCCSPRRAHLAACPPPLQPPAADP